MEFNPFASRKTLYLSLIEYLRIENKLFPRKYVNESFHEAIVNYLHQVIIFLSMQKSSTLTSTIIPWYRRVDQIRIRIARNNFILESDRKELMSYLKRLEDQLCQLDIG